MGRIYRPRMHADLYIPQKNDSGQYKDIIKIPSRVRYARLVSNDHNHADSLSLVLDWQDAGSDPRYISGGTVQFYLGNADDFDQWDPAKDLRFVGRISSCSRKADRDSAMVVEVECLDYTSFFLLAKPFASAGVPTYSDTLSQAWERICNNVEGCKELANNLDFVGVEGDPAIGDAVAERFKKLGGVHVKPDCDAWAVWQKCVGMLGLISYFDLDRCVVTTATDYYTAARQPVLLWGKNILSIEEKRNNDFSSRGVGITSYDPLTGTSLEALFPPLGDPRVKQHHVSPTKGRGAPKLESYDRYDFFQYPGVTDPDALQRIAERAYTERTKQELKGSIVTSEMFVETVGSEDEADFDLLSLRSGDVVRVSFEPDCKEMLASLPTESERVNYLVGRGYEIPIATIMAKQVNDLGALESSFYVQCVTTSLETSRDGGRFSVDIQYCNRIFTSGAAKTEET